MQTLANAAQSYMGEEPTTTTNKPKTREDGSTMRALAWFGTNTVKMIDAPIPDITEPDDVILRVTGSTICGSDLHLYHSEMLAMQKGDILGHEFMGVVERVGSDVRKVKVGERVVASFQIACGKCRFCEKKLSSLCDNTNNSSLMQKMYGDRDAGFFGYGHITGGWSGGQAEVVRVPYGDVNLLQIPDNVPDEQALYLSDILPTSYHNVVDTGVEEGDTVAIWGLGPIGQCSVKWAQLKGAKRVIGIDRVPERLALAEKEFGIETIDFSKVSDIPKKLMEMVPGGIDVALDCGTFHEPKTLLHKAQKALMLETDVPETLNEMIISVRKMGRIGLIAAYAGFANGVNIGAVMEKGVRLIGNGQAPVHLHWETILNDYLIPGKFDTRFLVSHRFDLEDLPELYAKFDKRVGGLEKVFLETKASRPPGEGFPKLSSIKNVN